MNKYIPWLVLICVFVLWIFFFLMAINHEDPNPENDIKWLTREYLKNVKKAQKATVRNKVLAEFYVSESERYRKLIEQYVSKSKN